MLDPRAIAMQGLGRSGRLVAVQGLWSEAEGGNAGARGGYAKRIREQYELIDEVRRKSSALKRALALAKQQADAEQQASALRAVYDAGMAAMRRAMSAIALADVTTPPTTLRSIVVEASAQMAVARDAFVTQLVGGEDGLRRTNNRRRAIIAIVLLLLT